MARSITLLAVLTVPHGHRALSTSRIFEISPKSAIIDCPHFKKCSGCIASEELTLTSVSNRARMVLEPILETPLEVKLTTDANGWRTQARLAAVSLGSGKSWIRGVSLGLYAAGSHDVIPIPDCVVHHPAINVASALLIDACEKAGVRGGDDLRYVQFTIERRSGLVALSLVWNQMNAKASAPQLPRLIDLLWGKQNKNSDTWHSIWVNYRGPAVGNAIFNFDPARWTRLRGHQGDYVKETLFMDCESLAQSAGLDSQLNLLFSPLNFRQANLHAFAQLVISLARYVPQGATVCELYAGVGAIGLALRPKLAELRSSDENPNNERPFELALRDQDARLTEQYGPASFLPLAAADAATIDAPGANLLIVDPPRKGLDPQLLTDLVNMASHFSALERIIYVSCGFDAFERDLGALTLSQNAPWCLEHAEAHVFFPGSNHVETLAIFDRRKFQPSTKDHRRVSSISSKQPQAPSSVKGLHSDDSKTNQRPRRRRRSTNNKKRKITS